MTASTRIKGTKLNLVLGSGEGTDFQADLTTYKLSNTDPAKDALTTFADAAAGEARLYTLSFTAVQSTDTTSLWSYAWNNGGTDVAFTLAPWGNAVATTSQPHIIGTIDGTSIVKPDLGGDAGSAEYSFDATWNLIGIPTLDTGTDD